MKIDESKQWYPSPTVSENYITNKNYQGNYRAEWRSKLALEVNSEFEKTGKNINFAVLAVDLESSTFLIMALTGHSVMNSVYRARAVIARMSATIRLTKVIESLNIEDNHQVADYLGSIGFKKIVVSDGLEFSYELIIQTDNL